MTLKPVLWATGLTLTNMGSTFEPITHKITKGVDQSLARHLTSPETCWSSLNMRNMGGRLEQTPWLETFQALTLLGSEPGLSPTHFARLVKDGNGNLQYLILNEYNARFVDPAAPGTQVALPCVQQSHKPNRSDIKGECLLYGINAADFAANLDYIEVEIHTDGSHFRWNRNGGAWSADLVIGPEVIIGTNGLRVSFQGSGSLTDYTGYTVGDYWSWTRIENIPNAANNSITAKFNFSSDSYNQDTYIGGVNRNIMRVHDGFITTVGYTRAYGMHVAVFFNHLFISQFATGRYNAGTISDGYNAATTPNTLGWSHLDNPDQLFSTLINEADQKQLTQQSFQELSNIGITGMAPWRNLLYVTLTDSTYTVQYVGLPNVMQISPLNSNIGCYFRAGMVRAATGIYFIGRSDFYLIKDYEPESIGQRVRDQFFTEICAISDSNHQRLYGVYNSYTKEVIWTYWLAPVGGLYQVKQIIYNEIFDTWAYRNMPCAASGYTDPGASCIYYGSSFGRMFHGYKSTLYADQGPGAVAGALMDVGGVTPSYTEPYFDTPFIDYGDPFHIKQSSGMFIDAAYLVGAGVQVSQSADNLIGDGQAPMTDVSQVWTPTLAESRLSLPRTAYRRVAYKFTFKAITACYAAVFNIFQEFILTPNKQIEK